MKPKKPRNKKHNPNKNKAKVFQQAYRENLHEVWLAGGHCLKETECEGVVSDEHLNYILSHKQQWTVLIFAFCENDIAPYVKSKLIPYPDFKTQDEVCGLIEKEIFDFCNLQQQKHLISPGYFMVPSIEVDLDSQRSAIADRFEAWGAFDRNICDIAWACKGENIGRNRAD